MDGDRPLSQKSDDRLGFTPVAEQLARAIAEHPAPEGLVFGIEGKWGSGKSTLINLTIEALRSRGAGAPEVISFAPWLVGNRDELLRNLFDELAAAAVKIDPIAPDVPERNTRWRFLGRVVARDAHGRLRQKELVRKAVGTKLQTFGVMVGSVGRIAKTAGDLGLPLGALAGTALEHGGEAAKGLVFSQSVSSRKSDLVDALRALSRSIVVFVDDLDRLEPREASEVLRLIRAVADFPNIIYVLSYDPEVIAQTLSKAVQVDDGAAFLEKIVQVSFRVPRPEAYDLRRWLQAEVQAMFADEIGSGSEQPNVLERLARAIDLEGGRYLQTPRAVVRALNSIRFHALPVRQLVDLADMVWLQLIRVGDPALYSWIEEYLVELAATAAGARVSEQGARVMAERLEQLLRGANLDVIRAVMDLREVLPGLSPSTTNPPQPTRVFSELGNRAFDQFISDRRLGSPQHYRYYFAFREPSGALPDAMVAQFIETATQAPERAIALFASLSEIVRPQGGNVAEVLIDRLQIAADQIPLTAIPAILQAFAETLDAPQFATSVGDFGVRLAWEISTRTTELLLRRVSDANQRTNILRQMFTHGRAISWLTHLLRREIFSHGHYGGRAVSPDRWLLTAGEFDMVLRTMLRRYRETPRARLLDSPDLLNLLYAWKQGSGTDEARNWVTTQIATDEGLLAFLSHVRSWVASSDRGIYYPLKRASLEPFLDYDEAGQRVNAIAISQDAPPPTQALAATLRQAFIDGEEFEG